MTHPERSFADAIRSVGLEPPFYIEPGKMYRFPGVGKHYRNTSGWCFLFDHRQGGCFGDWSLGISEYWTIRQIGRLSSSDYSELRRRGREGRAKAQLLKDDLHADAAVRALNIWNASPPAPRNHPYLVRKGVRPLCARLHRGSLTLPIMSLGGVITSLQFIDANGKKLLLSGGRKHGCVIPVRREAVEATRIIICEGFATGATLAEEEPGAMVFAAIDAGNLETVAVRARFRWPARELVIAGDDDRLTLGNPGATKAKAAAIAAGALIAFPQWPFDAPETLTDFNDLSLWFQGRSL